MILWVGINRDHCRIRIMRVDVTLMKLWSPIYVKEILIDYPNHGIFKAPVGPWPKIDSFNRPIPKRARLLVGHLYYLISLPLTRDELLVYNNNRNRKPLQNILLLASQLAPFACSSHPLMHEQLHIPKYKNIIIWLIRLIRAAWGRFLLPATAVLTNRACVWSFEWEKKMLLHFFQSITYVVSWKM